jgi:hypothetical protein
MYMSIVQSARLLASFSSIEPVGSYDVVSWSNPKATTFVESIWSLVCYSRLHHHLHIIAHLHFLHVRLSWILNDITRISMEPIVKDAYLVPFSMGVAAGSSSFFLST